MHTQYVNTLFGIMGFYYAQGPHRFEAVLSGESDEAIRVLIAM